MTGKPRFFYAKGTSYLLNVMNIGFSIDNNQVVHLGNWEHQLGKPKEKNAAVPGLDGRTVMWTGEPAQDPFCALMNPEIWDVQTVNYPASTLAMGPSVDMGVTAAVNAISAMPAGTPFALGGYSQGAAVMSGVLNEIMSGSLTARAGDFMGGTMFGNPRRMLDWRGPVGGEWSGCWDIPGSTTGGHGSFPATGPYARITDPPDTWVDFVAIDDIFTAVGDSAAGLEWVDANNLFLELLHSEFLGKFLSQFIGGFLAAKGITAEHVTPMTDAINAAFALAGTINDFTDADGNAFQIAGAGHTYYPAMPPPGDPDGGLTGFQIALKYLDSLAEDYARSPTVLPPTSAGWATRLYPPATQWYDTPATAMANDYDYGNQLDVVVVTAVPVRFASPTAVLGVSPTDRAYTPRTLTGATMRVASAPSGSALTVEVQHWDGFSWTTVGTLSIDAGSVTEASTTFSQAQEVGNLVRINCTSAGTLSPATGVAVDVIVNGEI